MLTLAGTISVGIDAVMREPFAAEAALPPEAGTPDEAAGAVDEELPPVVRLPKALKGS